MKKDNINANAELPTEVSDENGDPISLVDENGERIKELAFLASVPHGAAVTENDRLRKNIRKYRITAICFLLAFICFMIMFIISENKYSVRCTELFDSSIKNAIQLTENCASSEYDYDTNYRELTAELNVVRRMAFAATDSHDKETVLNNVYFLAVKLPDEYKAYINEILDGLRMISDNKEDNGYSALAAVIEKADLLNY